MDDVGLPDRLERVKEASYHSIATSSFWMSGITIDDDDGDDSDRDSGDHRKTIVCDLLFLSNVQSS